MRFLSVCSGIEAASVAWHPLGWEALAYSEIEKFPSAVLDHHYHETANLGDMLKFKEWSIYEPDVLVGGTPCQSFSVAGLRKGLDDPRGSLALAYLGIAERFHPRWILWENVPGVLSSNGGKDFGTFLGALAELGYGFAYRVLDAQYFGVPQRRRRVFVVGYLGDWKRAAAVLFERHSLQGHTPPSREEGQEVAEKTGDCTTVGSLWHRDYKGVGSQYVDEGKCVVMAHGQGNAEVVSDGSPSLTCNHEAPICFQSKASSSQSMNPAEVAATLDSCKGDGLTVAIRTANTSANGHGVAEGVSHTIDGANGQAIQRQMQVRRLTPKEAERLQGFPDDYTNIPYGRPNFDDQICPDGHRYKALGNSMAVPVIRWLGERIQAVDKLKENS